MTSKSRPLLSDLLSFRRVRPLRLLAASVLSTIPVWAAGQDVEAAPRSSMEAMQVAAVQIDTRPDIDANTRMIIEALASESEAGSRLVVFEECALTSYDEKVIPRFAQAQIDAALAEIAAACRRYDVYAVVGAPYREGDAWYNGAYVFGPRGELVKRYAKLHVVKPDLFEDGRELAIFRIDDVPATVMICHDERYPEIVRIPVLAGAKLGIYISCESKTPAKWDNYRCQIIARAVENQIAVVQCNTADLGERGGSHGHSRIIDQRGHVLAEASSQPGAAIRAVIRPSRSRDTHARRGADSPATASFWAEGLRLLREYNPDYFAPDDAPPRAPSTEQSLP